MNPRRTLVMLAAAGSLIAAPAVAQGHHKASHDKGGQGKKAEGKGGEGEGKRCAKTQKVGFSVTGTLVSFTADDAATKDVDESKVVLKVTRANRAARQSGELTGDTYTVSGEPVKLNGFDGADTPSAGDRVKVNGKIARTKQKCAADGATMADRYGEVDVRKVTISDRDEDAEDETEES